MKKTHCMALAVALLAGAAGTFAQNRMLTVEDAVLKGRTTLGPESLIGVNWVPDSYKIAYFGKKETQYCLVITDMNKSVRDTIGLLQLNESIALFNALISPTNTIELLKAFPTGLTWIDHERFRFVQNGLACVYNTTLKTLMVENDFPKEAENQDIHKMAGHVAYTLDNNLWIKVTKESSRQISTDGGKGIVYGQAVHRSEFGITKGTFWAPEGDKLAFYRMDESMVTEYPIYNLSTMPASADMIRYPFAGEKSHHVTVGVHDIRQNKTIYLQTSEPKDQYFTNIAWSNDGKYIFIAAVNRKQDFMSLRMFDAETGIQQKTLFTESNDKYVEPEHPLEFLPGSKDRFLWQSERDGYNHIYLYNTDGKMLKQLTKGNWMVTEVVKTDAAGNFVYFTATKESPLDNNLYRVNVSTGEISTVTPASGVHRATLSSDAKYVLDSYSSQRVPMVTDVLENNGRKVSNLLTSANPLADYKLGETSVFSIRSTDGSTDLYCRVIKPIDFDPGKKYPVVVYLYGGPHLQLVRNNWLGGADLWMNYMAQQGYVVFSIDNRGSSNRGHAFESATFRQLGTKEMEDQLAGVAYLKQQSFVDPARMAVFGWSFGGFMSTSLMTRQPGTFKVGVAGGPVIDWKMYEIMYTERYMDTPEENPDGYKNNNLLNYVDKLEGKLLLIHGTSDDVVLWQHSLLYLKKAVEKGKQLDYFVYPGHAHNVLGKDRVHLMQKITDYIKGNL